MPDNPSPVPPFADTATRAALPSGEPSPPPGEDILELDLLRRAVANDWGPRDAYERHWAGELVAAMHRQQLLRGIELKALAATETESPPTDAAVQRLLALARYGARLDKDLGAALRALRILRDRPDAWIEEPAGGTAEPERPASAAARTREPKPRTAPGDARTPEPEPLAQGTAAPHLPPRPNRHERRRRAALARQGARSAAA